MATAQKAVETKKGKRIVAKASKGQSFERALAETNKQYAGTLAKLAK